MKQLISTEKIRKLFNITIIESCSTKNYTYMDTETEKIADQFVIKYGYGEELDSFINKLIKSQGNSLVNKTNKEIENAQASLSLEQKEIETLANSLNISENDEQVYYMIIRHAHGICSEHEYEAILGCIDMS